MRMPEQERYGFWARLMEYWSGERREIAINKLQLREVVNAMDDWVEANWAQIEAAHLAGTLEAYLAANRAAINQAIPQPQRTILTTHQKEWIFRAVVRREASNGG